MVTLSAKSSYPPNHPTYFIYLRRTTRHLSDAQPYHRQNPGDAAKKYFGNRKTVLSVTFIYLIFKIERSKPHRQIRARSLSNEQTPGKKRQILIQFPMNLSKFVDESSLENTQLPNEDLYKNALDDWLDYWNRDGYQLATDTWTSNSDIHNRSDGHDTSHSSDD
jgi:hypothetical protein